MTSLPDYVSRMPEDQKNIYYVVGETRAQAAMSPTLEKLKQKGHEVLYVSEPLLLLLVVVVVVVVVMLMVVVFC